MSDPVQWPKTAKSTNDKRNDLAVPLVALIQALHEGDRARDANGDLVHPKEGSTPYSLQVITAGATGLTKLWTIIVGAAGVTSTGALAIIGARLNTVVAAPGDDARVRAAFVLAAAALLIGTAIAIALIVRGDVNARAETTCAKLAARARIAEAWLNNYQFAAPPPPLSSPPAAAAKAMATEKSTDCPEAAKSPLYIANDGVLYRVVTAHDELIDSFTSSTGGGTQTAQP